MREQNVYYTWLCVLNIMDGVSQSSMQPLLFPASYFSDLITLPTIFSKANVRATNLGIGEERSTIPCITIQFHKYVYILVHRQRDEGTGLIHS